MVRQILLAGVIGVGASNASAAPILHEEFNYTFTPGATVEGKVNQPENQTWGTAYTGTFAPSKIQLGNGNLPVPSQMPASSGNSARILGTTVSDVNDTEQNGKALRLPFGGSPAQGVAANSGGTVYYS